ncbi:MAG: MFS transporter [Verrucomicrobiae bacterium]|nr:MFS transporter [Verrucomicrobiae bacterium]
MRPPPPKAGYFVLEGTNSFATAYYFNYLMFLLRDAHGFTNLNNLSIGALHGLIYVGASWYGGRFGQRFGYFRSLRIGFGGMALSLALGLAVPALWGQLLALGGWTVAICFTWPMLEALVSEHEPPDRLPDRVGLYNVIWAGTAALGFSVGGLIFEHLGHASLYWLPLTIHACQWLAIGSLQRRHDRWFRIPPAAASGPIPHDTAVRPAYFRRLAWVANPFNYMAINTIMVVAPGIAAHLGLSVAQAGLVLSAWFYTRALAFLKLWWWTRWHYRFDWFFGAFALLLVSFVAIMLSPTVFGLLLAQVGFGWASAVLYYSSLYYAMDGSDAHGEHGGVHEALIGIGLCGGPAVSAGAIWLTGQATAPAWIVATGLAAAMGWVWRIRRDAVRSG